MPRARPDPLEDQQLYAGAATAAERITELPSTFQRLELALRSTPRVRFALGVHPLRAGTVTESELRLFSRLLGRTSYVGEIGLDYSARGLPSKRRQVEVFERLLSERAIGSKILSVHTRRAEADCMARIRQVGAHAILHWYSGALKHLDDALAAGMYFSVNPAMLGSRNGRRVLDALPPDRVLCETDGPYTRISGRAAEPRDIPWLVSELAARWEMPPAWARARIAENFRALVRAVATRQRPKSSARRFETEPLFRDRGTRRGDLHN
jgi:TatD DNase family protein